MLEKNVGGYGGREPVPSSPNFHCIRININKIDSQTQTNAISSRRRRRYSHNLFLSTIKVFAQCAVEF